ncbi:hypothetical protein MARPU_12435 [Marichromatium purpuratum 984]|uniref:Uncharacterized protein n=1 Tax=Marichromatium purpuratum 984 TaxID=765910 RepID=W0E4A6_MARPU|nr:hypothetical protein MARPU_12435 [Marichromatium purpuratum 984]
MSSSPIRPSDDGIRRGAFAPQQRLEQATGLGSCQCDPPSDSICSALDYDERHRASRATRAQIAMRLAKLSPCEHEVMALIAAPESML